MSWIGSWFQAVRRKIGGLLHSTPPQLLMWYPTTEACAEVDLPDGYQIRAYSFGDEEAWARLLNANGQLGAWDRGRIQEELAGDLAVEAQLFVSYGTELVATSGLYERFLGGQICWEIGWVATHPEHQGKGVGSALVAAALRTALDLEERSIALRTDDFRLPAMKIYLKLGFVPDYSDATYPKRWQNIFDKLGPAYAQYDRRQEKRIV